jgi:hypothetical protein
MGLQRPFVTEYPLRQVPSGFGASDVSRLGNRGALKAAGSEGEVGSVQAPSSRIEQSATTPGNWVLDGRVIERSWWKELDDYVVP